MDAVVVLDYALVGLALSAPGLSFATREPRGPGGGEGCLRREPPDLRVARLEGRA